MLGTAGRPTIGFIKSIRAQHKGVSLYALSVMGSAATIAALGADAYGVAVTQVVPLPTNAVVPVVRDSLNAWKDAGVASAPSHIALWGYINAHVLVEALRRAGRNLSRKGFIDAAWAIRRFDLGGYDVSFDQPGRNASRFVELTMISHAGKFIR